MKRYKQFQNAKKIVDPGITFPTKGRIYDKRRSARAHRKAYKVGMNLLEYSRYRLFRYV